MVEETKAVAVAESAKVTMADARIVKMLTGNHANLTELHKTVKAVALIPRHLCEDSAVKHVVIRAVRLEHALREILTGKSLRS